VRSEILLPLIVPIATAWIERQERRILVAGAPLNQNQLADASAAGVAEPERVRVLYVDSVPLPRRSLLRSAALALRLLSANTVGLTARYGIFVRQDFWGDRALLVHELAHAAQYERLGGIKPFLRVYLRECLVDGYPFGDLELEAAETAHRICRPA
jgi:hypothetical protein